MAYIYLLNLYEEIDRRTIEAKKKIDDGKVNADQVRFYQGRVDILSECREFLSKNLDDKLPKRIRNRLLEKR